MLVCFPKRARSKYSTVETKPSRRGTSVAAIIAIAIPTKVARRSHNDATARQMAQTTEILIGVVLTPLSTRAEEQRLLRSSEH